MHTLALIIFLLTYAGIAIGEIPGLALDRTGIAILGAIAMVASGVLSTEEGQELAAYSWEAYVSESLAIQIRLCSL